MEQNKSFPWPPSPVGCTFFSYRDGISHLCVRCTLLGYIVLVHKVWVEGWVDSFICSFIQHCSSLLCRTSERIQRRTRMFWGPSKSRLSGTMLPCSGPVLFAFFVQVGARTWQCSLPGLHSLPLLFCVKEFLPSSEKETQNIPLIMYTRTGKKWKT